MIATMRGDSTPLTTAADLMDKGLPVEIKDKPGSAVIVLKKQQKPEIGKTGLRP